MNLSFDCLFSRSNQIFFTLAVPQNEDEDPSKWMKWFEKKPTKLNYLAQQQRLLAKSQAETNKLKETVNAARAEYYSLERKTTDFYEDVKAGQEFRQLYNQSETNLSFAFWRKQVIENVKNTAGE